MAVEFLHRGVEAWTNQHGIRVLRLHYSADEAKTPQWAAKQAAKMTDPAMFRQEYEIDFGARLGSLVYQLSEEATLESSSSLPKEGTDYFGLDPHPVVPHAGLWLRVDRWGDAWAMRELWPSRIYGQPGNVPENDNRYSIKQWVETAQWLESESNPENAGEPQDVFRRVIDYSARAMGQGFFDERPEYNFQKRFEELGGWSFEDAIKDQDAGIHAVNEWLRPRDVEQADGSFKPKSKLHICQDRCPELICELKTNRYQQLTPLMAERSDPTGTPRPKRNHLTDCLKYLCMSGLEYIPKRKLKSTWKPIAQGVNY